MTATPKTTAAATRLLERYAELAAKLDIVEGDRAGRIAAANQSADEQAAPILLERGAISGALEVWWSQKGHELAGGKKSVQLAGCMIGTRKARPKMVHPFDSDDMAIAAVPTRYFKQATKIRYSLDRTAVLKLLQLGGKAGDDLARLGFTIEQPDNFFVERAEQAGTIGG